MIKYKVYDQGKYYGPLSFEEILNLINSGHFSDKTEIWKADQGIWCHYSDLQNNPFENAKEKEVISDYGKKLKTTLPTKKSIFYKNNKNKILSTITFCFLVLLFIFFNNSENNSKKIALNRFPEFDHKFSLKFAKIESCYAFQLYKGHNVPDKFLLNFNFNERKLFKTQILPHQDAFKLDYSTTEGLKNCIHNAMNAITLKHANEMNFSILVQSNNYL